MKKALFIRHAHLREDCYAQSEIRMVRELNKKISSKMILRGDENFSNNYYVTFKKPFNRIRYYFLKMVVFIPYYVIKNKIKFVIVDQTSIPQIVLLLPIKKILGVKIILDIRTVPVEKEITKLNKFNHFIARHLFDGATYITNATKNICERDFKHKFDKTALFSSGVDTKIFQRKTVSKIDKLIEEKLRSRFSLIYHGSITLQRGVPMLLDAIDLVKEAIPDILFVSISDNNNFLQNYCKENNLSLDNYILYLDAVDHDKVPYFIQAAEMGVIPYKRIEWWEISSPLKLFEYMAMGIPIILSDIKAHVDVLPLDSDYAVYFDPDKKYDLADKLVYAYKNREKLKRRAWKGRDLVQAKFTWELQSHKVENFLKQLS